MKLLREAMARPVERRNQRARREIEERNVAWAAKREADTMEKLEARLNAKIADERERIFKTIAQVVADGIFEPYEKKFTELEEAIRTRRDPVSVTAAAINHKGELMLTLSDGTILTPGRIGREAEVLDLPNPLAARRMR